MARSGTRGSQCHHGEGESCSFDVHGRNVIVEGNDEMRRRGEAMVGMQCFFLQNYEQIQPQIQPACAGGW